MTGSRHRPTYTHTPPRPDSVSATTLNGRQAFRHFLCLAGSRPPPTSAAHATPDAVPADPGPPQLHLHRLHCQRARGERRLMESAPRMTIHQEGNHRTATTDRHSLDKRGKIQPIHPTRGKPPVEMAAAPRQAGCSVTAGNPVECVCERQAQQVTHEDFQADRQIFKSRAPRKAPGSSRQLLAAPGSTPVAVHGG